MLVAGAKSWNSATATAPSFSSAMYRDLPWMPPPCMVATFRESEEKWVAAGQDRIRIHEPSRWAVTIRDFLNSELDVTRVSRLLHIMPDS